MMKISSLATVTALASLLLVGGAFAQTTAPAAKDAAPKAEAKAPAKEAKPRTAVSLDCSKQADDKKLKGKERKKFRKECMKEAGGAPAAAPAAPAKQ